MHRIAGHLQTYAWGVPGGLREWQSLAELASADPTRPEAELWFGAHPNGASPLLDSQRNETLRDAVDPEEAPVLVKLLAAARPLSIQIHPSADLAERIFAAQQDPAMPMLLADTLAKTEMLIALRPFSALQGLRDRDFAAAILAAVGGPAMQASTLVAAGDPAGAIRALLAVPAEQLPELTASLPAAARKAGLNPSGVKALELVADDYPGDPGVLVAALLDHQVLQAGEAVYVPAGVVHAYVQGTGVEVMTSSDNVLRLGLTPKVVAVDEALAALDPSLQPVRLSPEPTATVDGGTTATYAPLGAPFAVQRVSAGTVSVPSGHYRLVLAVDGACDVTCGDQAFVLERGHAATVLASEPAAEVVTAGTAFITTEAP
ncbi:MAG: mannose-6-phosphate isomerase, class I [Candidatus Nanopelagicales bacterium]